MEENTKSVSYKISSLSGEELLKLFNHLKSFSHARENNPNDTEESIADSENRFALYHMGNFLVNLSLEQQMVLNDALSNSNIEALNNFIKDNPNIDVLMDGSSKIKDPSPSEVQWSALKYSYNYLVNKKLTKKLSSKENQILKARNPICLKNIEVKNFDITKHMFIKKYPDALIINNIDNYISVLSKYADIKLFLGKLFEYFMKNPNAKTFITYVMFYLNVIASDTDQLLDITHEYINNIKSIIE